MTRSSRDTVFRGPARNPVTCAAYFVGAQFGGLVIIEHLDPDGSDKFRVRVKCVCGSRFTVDARRLRNDKHGRWIGVTNCGCKRDETAIDARLRKRGGARERCWQDMCRPGVSAGGHVAEDEDWPVRYVVVAGGQRTEHDDFEEAAMEFRIRAGRAAA